MIYLTRPITVTDIMRPMAIYRNRTYRLLF